MADSRSLLGARPVAMISASCVSLQLSLVRCKKPAGPCSSRTDQQAHSELNFTNDGPMPRSKRCRGPLPVTMNPPMPTSLPVPTNKRVERFVARVTDTGPSSVKVKLALLEVSHRSKLTHQPTGCNCQVEVFRFRKE